MAERLPDQDHVIHLSLITARHGMHIEVAHIDP